MIWFLFWKISRTEKTRKQKQNLMLNTNIQYQIHNIIPHERNTPKTNTNVYFLIQKFLLPSERDLMTDCGYCRSFHHLCNKCRGIMYHKTVPYCSTCTAPHCALYNFDRWRKHFFCWDTVSSRENKKEMMEFSWKSINQSSKKFVSLTPWVMQSISEEKVLVTNSGRVKR